MNNINQNLKNMDIFLLYKHTKDISIRNQIFEKYKYLADIIAKKYLNKGIENEDIFQIASIGLIYAIERFDVTKGFEFTSFATPTILGEIKKYFRDKGWAIKVPRKIQEISMKLNDANTNLSLKLLRAPTVKELAEYIGCSDEDVIEAIEAGKLFTSQSLNVTVDNSKDNSDTELLNLISDEKNYFEEIEINDFIESTLNRLNKLEKEIIIDRFYNNLTQSMIAKKLNISQMTVSRIEKKAIERLRDIEK